MFRHVNPNRQDRTALAPYNFVPLPQSVFHTSEVFNTPDGERVEPWASNDRFLGVSGWITLTLDTLTPVFVRGPVTMRDGKWDAREPRLRPEPCVAPDGRPVLPGSSLRGMIRALVEILAFGRMSEVTGERPFFRTVANDRIGDAYRRLLVRGDGGHRGGFACRSPDGGWEIKPVVEVLRVEHGCIENLGYRQHPTYAPDWKLQHKHCWFRRGSKHYRVGELVVGMDRPGDEGWEEGTLVLTGSAPKKKKEFVFAGDGGVPIEIPHKILERFHGDDQITGWQEKAFPRDQPQRNQRRRPGHLRNGEPVFFVLDEHHKLEFFGRAGMFRFPYDRSPAALCPPTSGSQDPDLAEAVFGCVPDKESTRKAIRGRVRFEDAVAVGAPPRDGWLEPPMVPEILSSPNVTAFQHYLTQDGEARQNLLTAYLDGDQTTIRGHKLYWHRWDGRGLDNVRHRQNAERLRDLRQPGSKDKQSTIIRPVKSGAQLHGKVHFENLTRLELGALLTALRLPDGCAHKIGMGKPLGLGSLRVSAQLFLLDRDVRYREWAAAGASEDSGLAFEKEFADAIVGHAKETGEPMFPDRAGMSSIGRIDALYTLLEWQRRPPNANTRPMVIEHGDGQRFRADSRGNVNEFRDRPVLPTPQAVAGRPEPPPVGEIPSPAPTRQSPGKGRGAGEGPPPRASAQSHSNSRPGGFRPRGPHPGHAGQRPAGPVLGSTRRDLAIGAEVDVVILEERTKKGGLRFQVVGAEVFGVLHPSSPSPPDATPGARLRMVVVTGGATHQFKYIAAE